MGLCFRNFPPDMVSPLGMVVHDGIATLEVENGMQMQKPCLEFLATESPASEYMELQTAVTASTHQALTPVECHLSNVAQQWAHSVSPPPSS